jgi:chromosome segregation ATPase
MKHVDRTVDIQVGDLEVMLLEGKLREANGQLAEAFDQNEKLANRLSEARKQIASLKEEVTSSAHRLPAMASTCRVMRMARSTFSRMAAK